MLYISNGLLRLYYYGSLSKIIIEVKYPIISWVKFLPFCGSNPICALLCTLPGRRPGTAIGGERARPGGGHSILGLPQDFHILGPEKNTLN